MEGGNLLALMELIKSPTIIETFVDILLCAVPIWLAVTIGLVIGWSWRPRWTGLLYVGFRSKLRFLSIAPPGFGARRLWLAFTAFSAFSVLRTLCCSLRRGKGIQSVPSEGSCLITSSSIPPMADSGSEISDARHRASEEHDIVTENDLEHLLHLVEGKDGETSWTSMMERTTSNMTYQAWRYEPEDISNTRPIRS